VEDLKAAALAKESMEEISRTNATLIIQLVDVESEV
jgi:hypothetical protein